MSLNAYAFSFLFKLIESLWNWIGCVHLIEVIQFIMSFCRNLEIEINDGNLPSFCLILIVDEFKSKHFLKISWSCTRIDLVRQFCGKDTQIMCLRLIWRGFFYNEFAKIRIMPECIQNKGQFFLHNEKIVLWFGRKKRCKFFLNVFLFDWIAIFFFINCHYWWLLCYNLKKKRICSHGFVLRWWWLRFSWQFIRIFFSIANLISEILLRNIMVNIIMVHSLQSFQFIVNVFHPIR